MSLSHVGQFADGAKPDGPSAVATRLVLDTAATWADDVMIGTAFNTRLFPPHFGGSPTLHFFVCLDRLERDRSLLHVEQFGDGRSMVHSPLKNKVIINTPSVGI